MLWHWLMRRTEEKKASSKSARKARTTLALAQVFTTQVSEVACGARSPWATLMITR